MFLKVLSAHIKPHLRCIHYVLYINNFKWKFGSGGVFESGVCVCVSSHIDAHAGLLRQVETSHLASKTQLLLPPTHELMLTEHQNRQLHRHEFHKFL